jgi:hypothetical protein
VQVEGLIPCLTWENEPGRLSSLVGRFWRLTANRRPTLLLRILVNSELSYRRRVTLVRQVITEPDAGGKATPARGSHWRRSEPDDFAILKPVAIALAAGGILAACHPTPRVSQPVPTQTVYVTQTPPVYVPSATPTPMPTPPRVESVAPRVEVRADPLVVRSFITTTFQHYCGRYPTTAELDQYTADYRHFEDLAFESTTLQARSPD